MTICYRLCKAQYAAHSGAGSALYPGRWNPEGVPVVYAASSVALAALEVLVHNDNTTPRGYIITEIHVPSAAVETISTALLPRGWNDTKLSPRTLREFGGRWVEEARSAVLEVPSVVVPASSIYVLNPAHPDFSQIRFLPSIPFKFDPRLK